jgi:hypothetical protein
MKPGLTAYKHEWASFGSDSTNDFNFLWCLFSKE